MPDETPKPASPFSEGLTSMKPGLEAAMAASKAGRADATHVEAKTEPKVETKVEQKTEEKKPEETKVETKTETKPEEKLHFKPPQEVIESKSKQWEEARKASYEKGLKDAREQWEKDKGNFVAKTEYEEAIKKLQDYESRLNAVALEQSPEFQREFQTREQAALALAKDAVADPDRATELEQILQMPKSPAKNQAFKAFCEGLDETEKALAIQALGDIEKTRIDKSQRLNQSRAELSARSMRAQELQKQRADLAASAFNQEWAAQTDPNGPLGGLDVETSQRINTIAKRLYADGTVEPSELAHAALAAAKEPLYLKDLTILHAKLAAANEEIAKLKGTHPDPTGGSATGKTSPKSETPKGVSPFSVGVTGMGKGLEEAIAAKTRAQY